MPDTDISCPAVCLCRKDKRYKIIDQFVAIKICSLCQSRRSDLEAKKKSHAGIVGQISKLDVAEMTTKLARLQNSERVLQGRVDEVETQLHCGGPPEYIIYV